MKEESHDPTRQVGAALASLDGRLLSTGTNRPPEVMNLSSRESFKAIEDDPNWKYFMLEHAERNAISNAYHLGHNLSGATMYVTLFPCADCARAIAAAEIKRLVSPTPIIDAKANEKWRTHFDYAYRILNMAGVKIDLV